jgi:N6-L-threonylcarbamoyladenine synthase
MLVHVERELKHHILGGTIDDAAGECFDKTAKLMGLPYPGGPQMDRLAKEGDPKAYDFPRPLLNQQNDDFSFSGLKTAVRYFLEKNPDVLDQRETVCDVCASVQAAIVDVLVEKTLRAAKRLGVGCITASGGVTCNTALRRELTLACKSQQIELRLCDPGLSTDNAAMIAVLAGRKLMAGEEPTDLDVEIKSGWALA